MSNTLYPIGARPLTNSATGTTGAVVATLTPTTGQVAHISGFEITSSGATAAIVVAPTVVGTLGGTLTYTHTAVAGAALGNTPLVVQFNPPIPASAISTNIVVTLPALGLGCTNATVVAHGYSV